MHCNVNNTTTDKLCDTTMKHTEEISDMLNKYNKEESLLDELLNDK